MAHRFVRADARASGGSILAKMKDWARFDRVVRGLMLAGAGFGR